MSDTHDTQATGGHGSGVGHVVPLRLLIGVLATLLVLTVVTVAVAEVDLGVLNLPVALAIAVFKASLVALYFMHLRWDKPFNGLILIFSLALVALFIGLTLLDSIHYQPDVIPGYAPDVGR